MDEETFEERARTLTKALGIPDAPDAPGVCVHGPARPHAFVPGERTYVEVGPAPPPPEPAPRRLDVYYGSFVEASACEPAFDMAEVLERALVHGAERLREDEAAESVADDEGLFEAHARFLRGLPVPPGWYRRGERLAAGVWAVDLDVFVDLALPAEAWERLRGRPMALSILGEDFEIELPREAGLDEAWTLEACGLFEPEAGAEEAAAEVGDEGEVRGRFGDLHVLPLVI